jgi:hypothetical protein
MVKISEEILRQIEAEIKRRGGNLTSLDELNKIAAEVTSGQNRKANADFEGLSSDQMHLLLNYPFSDKCYIRFKKVPETDSLLESPIMIACKTILLNIDSGRGLKLTQKGNLPRKVVSQIYDLPLITWKDYGHKPATVPNELDYFPAAMAHALIKLSRVVKTRKNALHLTTDGKKCMQDNWLMFQSLFRTFTSNYNKGYFDYYGENNIGNLGILFVIYLLDKFGDNKQESKFYAGLYFKAFPDLIREVSHIRYSSSELVATDCFEHRVFTRGLSMFGLIEMETLQGKNLREKYLIRTSSLFHKVFEIKKMTINIA